ncbi:MAG: efflux RND transporter periplasmic adaptor subunit, partial [Erythrobacter sp.]|nr:efflux RND transporter periplasmic adaptor subunit [Erythrobacter sp.]
MPRWLSLAIGLSALFLTGCGGPVLQEAETVPRPAKLLQITEATTQRSNSLPAVVRSVRTTDLAFQVGGQIVEWNAIDGAEFRRGDLIARLDARSFQAAVAQAEAQYKNADSEYQRALRLIEEDAISRSVVESRDAQRQIAKASLDTAKKNLSDTALRAPFSGFVGRTNVEQFQNVAPQQPVLVLQSQAVEAIVNVPASFVLNSNRVRYFNTFIELDAAPGRRFAATFREATGQADSSTQTFEGHFSFTPPRDLVVLTGMTATLFFETEAVDIPEDLRGVSVPLSAIMSDGDARYVWAVKGRERTLERRNVEVADAVGESMIVTDGLNEGDTIVA